MKSPTPAAAPDPAQTAAAQSASNKATAVTQYGLNATNQNTPQGSLTYNQIGAWDDGTPRFEANTTLSAPEQKLFDTNTQTQGHIADIGNEQSQKIGNLLNTPINLNTATEDKINQLGAARLDPRFQREGADLETNLINRGVRPGTEAYDRAHTAFDQSKNDAYNQLYLSGRGQGAQEALTQRNQPINEISALLSGSQVSQPNFNNTPQVGVAPTDYIGATGQSLAQSNVGFNAAQQRYMGMMNGLFGLGKTAATAGFGAV